MSVVRRWQWQVALGMFALLRVLVVWDRPIARFPDTIGYESLNFLGNTDRFWPVTLPYWIIRDDTMRVAMHTSIGVLAIGFLATVVVTVCDRRIWTGIPILLVGCAPQITRFDLTILSESLGLSYLAFTLGAIILLFRRRTRATIVCAIVAITLVSMTRSPQMLLLVAATFVALIAALRSGTQRSAILAMSLVALTGWGVVQLNNNKPMSTLVFYTVLDDHVLHDPKAASWFVAHGMPFNSDIESSTGYLYPEDLPSDVREYLRLPRGQMPPTLMKVGGMEFARWVHRDGWKTYAHYVVTHPRASIRVATDRVDFMLNPADELLLPLKPRVIVPHVVFGDYQWWLVAAVLAFATAALRRLWAPILTFLVGSLGMSAVWFAVVAHTSGIEHGRHAITVAVAIRLVCVVSIVYVVNELARQRKYLRTNV